MIKHLFSIFFASLLVISAPAQAAQQPLDQMVAVVNDDVITQSELQQAVRITSIQLRQQNVVMPSKEKLRKEVLNQLINKRLQLQFAKQAGISLSDADVDKALENVAKMNGISVNTLYSHLKHDGISPESYRHEVREQITMQKVQQQEVVRRMAISSKEVELFMKTHPQSAGPKEYHLIDILIPMAEQATPEQVSTTQKIAANILKQLKQGKSIASITAKENQAIQVTDLKWRKLSEMPNLFAENVSAISSKSFVGPIKAPNGLHILHIKNLRTLNGQSAMSKKEIEEILLQKKFNEALQKWLAKLRSQAYIQMSL